MRLLLFSEFGSGSLARSLYPGLVGEATVTVVDPYGLVESAGSGPLRHLLRVRNRARVERAGSALVEAAEQLRPDAVLIIKGRGVDAGSIARVRALGIPVGLFYPDNPAWAFLDSHGADARLAACTLVVVGWQRLATELEAAGVHARVLPFGYDDRWFVPTAPGGDRQGVVFLGTWSPRRGRYLSSLEGLPLIVRGSGWARERISVGGPVREAEAGALLARAAVGVNLLHPQCAGAHNMRTREIAATGAVQLTDPGTDGTPLRAPESCAWFSSPGELRALVEHFLACPDEAAAVAGRAQVLTAEDTYVQRGKTLVRWLAELA